MNWLKKQLLKRKYNRLIKQKDVDFLKFKRDYEHSPLNEFYKNGERVFSRKEIEYWKIIDIKNSNNISKELKDFEDFNIQYQRNLIKSVGKIHIGTITVNENNSLLEIPLAVDRRTNEMYFDIKKDKLEQDRLNQVSYNWKPYQSDYVNFMIYEKIRNGKKENQALDFKNVSILSNKEQYNTVLHEIKNNVGKGVNVLNKMHNNENVKQAFLPDKLDNALEKDTKELDQKTRELTKSNGKEIYPDKKQELSK